MTPLAWAADGGSDAPGTPQQLKRVESDAWVDYFYAHENDTDFIVYCFNSRLHWPEALPGTDTTEMYVPDAMQYLSDETKDKLYRVFYAGYPYNNAGIYQPVEESWVPSAEELNEWSCPPEFVKQNFTSYVDNNGQTVPINWDEFGDLFVKNGEGAYELSRAECQVLCGIAQDVFFYMMGQGLDAQYPEYYHIIMGIAYFDCGSLEAMQVTYAGMVGIPTLSVIDDEAHYVTQLAIWRILYEAGVTNNKSLDEEMQSIPLMRELVAFANGTGDYANAVVPARGTTSATMSSYQENEFGKGLVLLDEQGKPVGKRPIVFTQAADGTYVSEILHFSDEAYTLPYTIELKYGETTVSSALNYGKDQIQFVVPEAPSEDVTASFEVRAANHFPSDVYQYVADSQKDKAPEDKNFANKPLDYQDMGGCYFTEVPLSLSLSATFVPEPDGPEGPGEPDGPDNPDNPDKPDNPGGTDKPTKPGDTEKSEPNKTDQPAEQDAVSDKIPKTGDATPFPEALGCALMAFALVLLARKMKRE